MENYFLLDLIASLKKTQSQKQIKEDIKNLGDFKLPLIGTLSKSKTKAQLKQDLSALNGTINLTGKVDSKGIATSVQQATTQAQKQIDSKPVEVAFSVKKEKLLNDIKLLAQQNSRLFKDTDMSIKYNSLLDNAELAKNTVELSTLRTQLGSLRSELKVTGNAGLTMTDALKNGLSKVLQLFGSTGVIMQFTKQLRNAWTEAKELDKSMTDLSRVNAEITRSGFPDYLDRVIDKTKQLAVATKDYIDAVTTFSRAGYNLTDSETLADMAVQLEKVGDMSAVDASKALLSGLQGYAEIDGYGMDQLTEKAQALNDKIDLIGNTASITQAELSQGIQAVGSVMNDANTSVDEFLALLGAGNRAVQDSNRVALAIRTSALRIRGCTAELQEMGEETHNVIESTSTLAEKIKALTNINGSGGVNILEADEETFRSIYDIYNDIAKIYDKMSDKDASALLDLIAGKNRSNQISAILQNMSEANELLERSLNATGTASAEYEIYLNSAQAATERFGVAMTETYSNIISGDTVKGLANAGTAVLDFANSWNILEGTLKGFLTLGILKGITTLTVAFKNSAVQISNYGSALEAVKNLNTYAQDVDKYANAMDTLKASCVNLTDAQLKQVLANKNLSDSQLIEILQLENLEVEEQKARLAQLGLIQTTETQTVAQGAATASTFSFSAAMKGLGASIKAAWMTNPIGIIIMGVSTAIGVATSAISKYNQQVEETRRANIESATTASENADKLKDLYNEYTRLASIQDKTTSEEESFKTAVENITIALGNKAKVLEGLTAGTDAYAEALKNATKEEFQSQAVDATVGRKSAEEELSKTIFSRWSGSKISIDSRALSEDAQKAKDIVSETLKEYKTFNDTWDFHFSGDMADAYEYYNTLLKAKEELVLAGQDDETLLDTKVYSDLNNVINSMSESMDTYIQKRYEEEKLIYMSQNGIPSTVEEYKKMEDALIDVVSASDDLQDKFKEMLMSDFTSLATGAKNVGEAVGDAVSKLETTNHLSDQLTTSQEALDKFQSSVKSAYDAYGTLLSGNYSSSDLLDSIQAITQSAKDMGKTINWEFIANMDARGIYDSMELLGGAIEHISKEYAKSVLAGAGIDVNSEFGQMLVNMVQEAYEAEAVFTGMNSQLDNLQSSYQTLTGILESYNETGYITLDNLQSLLTADENLIAMLEVENGQLVLNQAAYENLVVVQLQEFKTKLNDAAAAEIETLAKQKAEQATNQNADASQNAVAKLDAETQAFNRNTSAAIANAVAKAEESGVSTEEIQSIFDKYTEVWNSAVNNYSGNFDSFMGGSKSASKAGKSAGDAYVEAFEKELKELQTLRDQGKISETQYLNALRALYTRYFKNRKEYLDEYKKYESEYLSGMLALHNKALSGISTLFSHKIDSANNAKDEVIDALNAEKDAANEAYQKQMDAIDELIAKKNKRINAIQEEINKIKEAASARKLDLEIQEAEYNLAKMQAQKNKQVYKDGQLVWDVDYSGIRDAKEKVTELQEEKKIAELEKQIDLIEKQIDLLNEQKTAIQKMMDESDKYYDNLIKEQEKYWDSMIKGMEDNKSRWEELANIQEIAEAFSAVQQVFGDLGYTVEDVLNGSDAAFEDFKSRYISLISDVNSNSDFTDGLVYATGVAKENLGSFLDKTQETSAGIDELASKGSELGAVADGMSGLSTSASDANTNISKTASSVGDVASNVSNLGTNLSNINSLVTEEQTAFNNLKSKIDEVIEAIDKKTEAIKEEQNAVGIATSSEMADFLLLKEKILEVKETLESFGTQDEGLIGNIASAIQSLNDISFNDGIITQFNNLKEAIDSVVSAINGGSNSESSGSKGQGSKSGSDGAESGGKGSKGSSGANSLTGAITEIGNTANEVIGESDAEGDGTVIGEFSSLETAVNDVATAIGSGESNGGKGSENGESDNLIGSIVDLGETSEETLGEPDGDGVIGKFNEFEGVIEEAANQVKSISDGLEAIDGQEVECTIKVNVDTNGNIPAFSEGTLGNMNLESGEYTAQYGKAFAEGTGKYKGLPKDEKNALVSEYGQTEMTVLPNGNTIITDEPTMMDLPKGTVIYNEDQTKQIMDNKVDVSGKAHADGTNDGSWIGADGHRYRDLQPGDRAYELQKAFEPLLNKWLSGEKEILSNAVFDGQKQMEKWTKEITNNTAINNITNNRNVQQPVVHQQFNITMPNVTNSTSAEALMNDLQSIATKKYQVNW